MCVSYLASSWFKCHAGWLQHECGEILIFLEIECYPCLHFATVADVEGLHVLRKSSFTVVLPGFATMQWTEDILLLI